MTSVRELLASGTVLLAGAGIESAAVDARLLLEHSLGIGSQRLVLIDDVDATTAAAYRAALERRARREPLQHIVGTAPFRYLELAVGPGVFIPRPETELLVEAVLPHLAPGDVAVDLCAGSGALGLAVAHERAGVAVYAVEADAAALAWLRRNTEGSSVTVVAADVTAGPVLPELFGTVAAVVSNPPYVPESTVVAPEVDRDPAVAVFAGRDGLSVIPAVIARAAELLRSGGVLAVEHDETHAEAVPDLLRESGEWAAVRGERDLADRPRYAVAIRR